jgi:hypothetical protein
MSIQTPDYDVTVKAAAANLMFSNNAANGGDNGAECALRVLCRDKGRMNTGGGGGGGDGDDDDDSDNSGGSGGAGAAAEWVFLGQSERVGAVSTPIFRSAFCMPVCSRNDQVCVSALVLVFMLF